MTASSWVRRLPPDDVRSPSWAALSSPSAIGGAVIGTTSPSAPVPASPDTTSTLTAVMAESDTRLLGQPLTAIVQEIQQGCLRSTEETFGNLQALAELAPLPFGPDLVYVTLHGRGGNL